MHIAVCVATYLRPEMLAGLLEKLSLQETGGCFSFSVTVADNDESESARIVVANAVARLPIPISYCLEPRRNISHVRNKAIANSAGDLIAFIDDDEVPPKDWLLNLFLSLESFPCAGVLGAVRPLFLDGTPDWVKRSGLFDRPEHTEGYVLSWEQSRTGNVLFRREILRDDPAPFRPEFGTGRGDVDFFHRMIDAGHKFVWSTKSPVYEFVLSSRWSRSLLFKRALLRGRNRARHQRGLGRDIAKSIVAAPAYVIALPFLIIFGHHLFMRYFIKLGDHIGLLLAVVGFDFVRERPM